MTQNNNYTEHSEYQYDEHADIFQDDILISSKIPGLNEVQNMRFRPEDAELKSQIWQLIKYAQNLENIVKYKNKEIEKLKYMIKYLTMGKEIPKQ